jgi:hypothetical protein
MNWTTIRSHKAIFQALDGAKSSRRAAMETREKVEDHRPVTMTPKRLWKILGYDAEET